MDVEWKRLFTRQMLICIVHGFISGLPLYVLIQMVPAWLRTNDVNLTTIGLFGLVQLPYAWKFLWAPLMDRFNLPFLGKRRGWLLATQVLLMASIYTVGQYQPQQSLDIIIVLVVAVAVFSASQDIVIDAYRRELLEDDELGTGISYAINSYRISSLVPGSLALLLADHLPWDQVFSLVSLFMLIGIVSSFLIPETSSTYRPKTLTDSFVEPFKEFWNRKGPMWAITILSFMVLYKLGDSMATALSTVFYLDIGFTLSEIGVNAKVAALWSSIAGGILGGLLMLKLKINKALWLFGAVQLLSIPGFALLSVVGHNPKLLFAVVSFEYLGVGLGTVAFTAFIASLCHRSFTATQFALLSALTALPRILAGSATGKLIESVGYTSFFILCTALAVPGMLLLLKVAPWNDEQA